MVKTASETLPREEVVKAVERRGPSRVPMVAATWWGEGLREEYGDRLDELAARYPDDAERLFIDLGVPGRMDLSWYDPEARAGQSHDAGGVIPDWKHLDEFIEKMPDPEAAGLFDEIAPRADEARAAGRYFTFGWWNLFFEKPWSLRGMQDLMMDYYLHPEEIHRLHDALCTNYCALIRRAGRELKPDGFWTSDDLGNQRQLMMKPEHFREFIKPYYRRVGEACREFGMHFWLHSCGDNTEILDDLAEVGVHVFHPVQKHTMDEPAVARQFGDRLCFLVGFDVQHTLREASPEEVRREVRYLIDTFDRPEGGMCIAAGNGIVGGTPLENIEAFLDEARSYGAAHRARV